MCPKDPNLRTNCDPEEELLRIEEIVKLRKKGSKSYSLDLSDKLMSLLKIRYPGNMFVINSFFR